MRRCAGCTDTLPCPGAGSPSVTQAPGSSPRAARGGTCPAHTPLTRPPGPQAFTHPPAQSHRHPASPRPPSPSGVRSTPQEGPQPCGLCGLFRPRRCSKALPPTLEGARGRSSLGARGVQGLAGSLCHPTAQGLEPGCGCSPRSVMDDRPRLSTSYRLDGCHPAAPARTLHLGHGERTAPGRRAASSGKPGVACAPAPGFHIQPRVY